MRQRCVTGEQRAVLSSASTVRRLAGPCSPLCRYVGWSLLLIASLSVTSDARASQPVRATLSKETAWMGEGVELIVTLYSPGPFSGTAAFELPTLSRTAIVKTGSPVVGSEQVDGDSYLTQRHEFTLYTQRSGEIVIPSFRVRFSGKSTFTADPEPMSGTTSELRFQSKRPPGTESMDVVVSATAMKIDQTWNPLPQGEIEAGDVLIRTIARSAEGTTAMLLPPVSVLTQEGVQVYAGTPEVQDTNQRGVTSARRTDTLKYQFQQAGRFTLPEIAFVWWDPQRETLARESVAGLAIDVSAPSTTILATEQQKAMQSSRWMTSTIAFVVIALVAWLIHKPVVRSITAWQEHYNCPESNAARRLRSACAANDASAAYAAMMTWMTARRGSNTIGGRELVEVAEPPLREPWQELTAHLFANKSAPTDWRGNRLWRAFTQTRRRRNREVQAHQVSALPPLNPTVASR